MKDNPKRFRHAEKKIAHSYENPISPEGLSFCEKREVEMVYLERLVSRDLSIENTITSRRRNVDECYKNMDMR